MKRAIARLVENPLAELILRGDLDEGGVALVGVEGGRSWWTRCARRGGERAPRRGEARRGREGCSSRSPRRASRAASAATCARPSSAAPGRRARGEPRRSIATAKAPPSLARREHGVDLGGGVDSPRGMTTLTTVYVHRRPDEAQPDRYLYALARGAPRFRVSRQRPTPLLRPAERGRGRRARVPLEADLRRDDLLQALSPEHQGRRLRARRRRAVLPGVHRGGAPDRLRGRSRLRARGVGGQGGVSAFLFDLQRENAYGWTEGRSSFTPSRPPPWTRARRRGTPCLPPTAR